ncbi:DEAD/DEAH box helicase [Phyllobacterium myrsinacearum]|uniref:Superfamily II DNA or RNA helicase n=1 Tax=Phyllobacterium myrsinacearum TaxID=28101 RepID=A0A839EUC2_9HYPH|nr:DEAD/DEAH box helicase [Phyllobacterium myrsinacearum]MBA8881705.1 superfamily II DNA or RNA helicase [Phyllobacterium myrsinacearum]
MKSVILAHNAVTAQIRNADKSVDAIVSDLLSYNDSSIDGTFASNVGMVSAYSSFYQMTNHTFPAGFVHLVERTLIKKGYQVRLVRKALPEPLGPFSPIVDEFGNDNPDYDFQIKALRSVEKYGRGIIQVATGGGKSKIAKLIMARYRRMTLFITTRGVLLYQMKDQLDALGLNTGLMGDGEMKVTKGVNLGMVQTLVQALEVPDLARERRAVTKSQHLNKKKDTFIAPEDVGKLAKQRYDEKVAKRNKIIKVLEMMEVVIGEEAHEAGGNSYYEILKYCKNAQIRVALTATPFMRTNAQDNLRLMAAFGSILIKVSEELLIKRGILATPHFKFMSVEGAQGLHRTSPWQRAYKLGYTDNMNMHKAIIRDGLMARKVGLPFMVLVQHTSHGDTLVELMKRVGLRIMFIRGENNQKERKAALTALKNGTIDGLIGTTILDVGVDVPAVGLVMLAGGGKAEVALRQRIGRGLRGKPKGIPNFAFIAMYSANLNTTLREHDAQRRAIIQQTPGFAEGILPEGQDFNWSIFARKEAA